MSLLKFKVWGSGILLSLSSLTASVAQETPEHSSGSFSFSFRQGDSLDYQLRLDCQSQTSNEQGEQLECQGSFTKKDLREQPTLESELEIEGTFSLPKLSK